MSDQRILEFRERAERGLELPDLATLDRRGHALRRHRVAAGVGALALAVLAGAGVAAGTGGHDDASDAPAGAPSPSATSPTPGSLIGEEGLRLRSSMGEDVLLPGPSSIRYDRLRIAFDVPGEGWEWWGVGMGLRRAPGVADEYAASVFFLLGADARLKPCDAHRTEPLGTDPERLVDNVAPLLRLARSTVLEQPRVVQAFGTSAVHLRLETQGTCAEEAGFPSQLRGWFDQTSTTPGWDGTHILDLWHVLLPTPRPRSVLVASWDLGGTPAQHRDRQNLLTSMEIAG